MNDKLRELQLEELEILRVFSSFCDTHNLKYWLIGGTLLGAVRHRGFIPWDDDIDVMMPKADYELLAQLWQEKGDTRYFYQSPETDPWYYLSYAKLRKNGTEVFEERFRDAKFHKGIFIDIFPLVPCPRRGLLCHFLFNVLAVMNYRGQVDSGERYKPYTELSGKFGYLLLRPFSKRGLVKIRKRLLDLSVSLSNGEWAACYPGAYGYRKEVYRLEWFRGERKESFEGNMYWIPCQSEEVLHQGYGEDYMVPKKIDGKEHISFC